MNGLCEPTDLEFDVDPHTAWRKVLVEACRQFQSVAEPGKPRGVLMFVADGRCVDGTPDDTVASMGICDGAVVYTEFIESLALPEPSNVPRRLDFDAC